MDYENFMKEFKPLRRLVTLRAVAAEINVSALTVQRYMREDYGGYDSMRKLILKAAKKLYTNSVSDILAVGTL